MGSYRNLHVRVEAATTRPAAVAPTNKALATPSSAARLLHHLMWSALALPVAAALGAGAPAATMPVASIDPQVTRAAGQPCVVELFRDREQFAGSTVDYTYAPPPAAVTDRGEQDFRALFCKHAPQPAGVVAHPDLADTGHSD